VDHFVDHEELIRRRLADARSHSELGRHAAAAERLDEPHGALSRHLADSRGESYRRAVAAAGILHDPAAEEVARTAPILGLSPAGIAGPIAAAGRELATARASPEVLPAAARPGPFAAWEARHAAALERHARLQLSNSQMAIHNAVLTLAAEGTADA
jgi:hypothetical protein